MSNTTYIVSRRKGSSVGCADGSVRVSVTLRRETFHALRSRADAAHHTISGEVALIVEAWRAARRYLPPCDDTMPHTTNQGPSNDLQPATPDAGVADPNGPKIGGVVAVCEHDRQAHEVSFQEHLAEEGPE